MRAKIRRHQLVLASLLFDLEMTLNYYCCIKHSDLKNNCSRWMVGEFKKICPPLIKGTKNTRKIFICPMNKTHTYTHTHLFRQTEWSENNRKLH